MGGRNRNNYISEYLFNFSFGNWKYFSHCLERQFGVTEYSVQDEHTLRIYDTSLDMAAVNKALVVQDIAVISSQLCNDTLEDYFKKITGGEGIA